MAENDFYARGKIRLNSEAVISVCPHLISTSTFVNRERTSRLVCLAISSGSVAELRITPGHSSPRARMLSIVSKA